MRKRIFAICLSVVIAIVLLAAFVPSCTGGGTGTIEVNATSCGAPWTGNVSYTLTPASGSPVNGNNVTATFSVATGTWTCAYVSGGPGGAYFLKSITPSATQTVSANQKTTFTLNFELKQDAAIQWLWWSVNGMPWLQTETEPLGPCNITDTHFAQWVDGCVGYNVTLNEMSGLVITAAPGNPGPVWIYVVNADCAVNKTAEQMPIPPVKKSQVPSINNATANVGDNITLLPGMTNMLDVHTVWQLVKGTNYTKAINWLGISKAPFELPGPHPCVLFELVVPMPGAYQFTLVASAHVDLVGSTDVNPVNNDASSPFHLTLVVNVGP